MADGLDIEDCPEDDLSGDLDGQDPPEVQDITKDMPKPRPGAQEVTIDVPDMDRFQDENWHVLVRCRARLEALADMPKASIKDRVAAARGAAAIAKELVVLVGLDKTKEMAKANRQVLDVAKKAASQAVTMDLFGQLKPQSPPPFVTKVGDTNAVRGSPHAEQAPA